MEPNYYPPYDPMQQTALPPNDTGVIALDWNTLVVTPIVSMVNQFIKFIPDLLTAIYILIFAWVIGKILQFVVYQFLNAIRFDHLAEKIGLTELLDKDDKKASPSLWMGTVIFWLTIIVGLVMALNRLRLRLASAWLDNMLDLMVSIFSAVTILTLGIFLSEIVARMVKTAAQKLSISNGTWHAGFIRVAVLFFTLILTLAQFHMPQQYIFIAVAIVFVTLCVTFAIAFGFGGSAWAGKVLDKFY